MVPLYYIIYQHKAQIVHQNACVLPLYTRISLCNDLLDDMLINVYPYSSSSSLRCFLLLLPVLLDSLILPCYYIPAKNINTESDGIFLERHCTKIIINNEDQPRTTCRTYLSPLLIILLNYSPFFLHAEMFLVPR